MKSKFFAATVIVLFLASILIGAFVSTAKAHTEEEPYTTDLIADGGSVETAVDVGDVLMWNDEGYLYVKYVTTDDWWITEVHLEVATDLNGIPQTKGNPVPGLFTYGEKGLWTQEYEFDPIPLPGAAGTELYIAAHAKVWDETSLATLVLESGAGVPVYGPLYEFKPLGDPAWGTAGTAVATWKHPNWPMIPGSSAVWISTSEYIENARPDSWRWFSLAFNVPGYPVDGSVVTANSDNAEGVFHNGVLIGEEGRWNIPNDATTYDPHEWASIKTYAFTPVAGANTLDFIVHNYAYPTDSSTVNPTGLIYKVEVDYLTRCETAWGAGAAFSGKNWATYFTYKVQG